MKNKMTSILMILMAAIILIGVIAFVVIMKFTDSQSSDGPSIDQMIKQSVEVPEITTNLADDSLIRVSFMVETDSKKAKEELEKRDFQIKDIVIQELSETKPEQLNGKTGKAELENKLKTQINQLMQKGKVENIYTTSSILQ